MGQFDFKRFTLRQKLSTTCDGRRDPIGVGLCYIFDCILSVVRWLGGRTVKPGGTETGVREAVQLTVAMLTAAGALLVYIQRAPNQVDPTALVTYIVASLIPIIAMLSICMARQAPKSKEPAFNYPTRVVTWRLAAISFLFIATASTSYIYGFLPGQAIAGTYLDTETAMRGIVVPRVATFEGKANWNADLLPAVIPGWKIITARAYRNNDDAANDRQEMKVSGFSVTGDATKDTHIEGRCFGVEKGNYYIFIELEKRDGVKDPKEPTTEDINLSFYQAE